MFGHHALPACHLCGGVRSKLGWSQSTPMPALSITTARP